MRCTILDEKLLKKTIEALNINNIDENIYSADATTDLIIQSQQALENASIKFKKVP